MLYDLFNDWYSYVKYFFVMLVGIVIVFRFVLYVVIMRFCYVSLIIVIVFYSVIILDCYDLLGFIG